MACRCVLESIKRLDLLNDELKGRNFPKLAMGIGINTGDMSVGNMGSETIQNYTVMGDAVNLASRVEGLTRIYGNDIMLGETTYEAVKNDFTCRELDRVIVKGKTTTLLIYELLYEGPVKPEDTDWLNYFTQGRALYSAGNFPQALEQFELCQKSRPEDKSAQYYVEKCTELSKHPTPENWTGVNSLKEK
jgi:adenylate cyclase